MADCFPGNWDARYLTAARLPIASSINSSLCNLTNLVMKSLDG